MQRLSALIVSLEHDGDPSRLFAARSAYNFKHSWLEMAQALVEVQNSGRFTEWGHDTFLDYCDIELGLKRTIVDKLTTSFSVLSRCAPERLESPTEEEPIPSYQALDYYARATGEMRFDGNPPKDAPEEEISPELNGQLYSAVFEQGCTHKQIRERFDPIIRPKSPSQEQQEATKKALNTTRKLLEQIEEVGGISADVLRRASEALAELQTQMESSMEALKILLKVDSRENAE